MICEQFIGQSIYTETDNCMFHEVGCSQYLSYGSSLLRGLIYLDYSSKRMASFCTVSGGVVGRQSLMRSVYCVGVDKYSWLERWRQPLP